MSTYFLFIPCILDFHAPAVFSVAPRTTLLAHMSILFTPNWFSFSFDKNNELSQLPPIIAVIFVT